MNFLETDNPIPTIIAFILLIVSIEYAIYILRQTIGSIEDKNFFKYLIRRFKEFFKCE